MTTATVVESSDLDKVFAALGGLTSSLGSFEDAMDVLGIGDLPSAQRWGILFGCVVFSATVSVVIALLIFGGSFRRIEEQARTGQATVTSSVDSRRARPLLLERLLDAREEGAKRYAAPTLSERTPLLESLLNVAPRLRDNDGSSVAAPRLVDDTENETTKTTKKGDGAKAAYHVPEGYQDDYVLSYRRCQDAPGGKILSGVPESRFEAYARAYAGCGARTDNAYRRSYARVYETVCCASHAAEKEYAELYAERPHDVHGRTVRLEAFEAARHAQNLFALTNGDPYDTHKAYDPLSVWGFSEHGPFASADELAASPAVLCEPNQAAFAVVSSLTNKLVGIVRLVDDEPRHLRARLESPVVKPSAADGSVEQLEACFLLLDRLFARGYRRVWMSMDAQDSTAAALPKRLGFTREGTLPRNRVVRESSVDDVIFGLTNADWTKGARTVLYGKLHGSAAAKADAQNERREAELEVRREKTER